MEKKQELLEFLKNDEDDKNEKVRKRSKKSLIGTHYVHTSANEESPLRRHEHHHDRHGFLYLFGCSLFLVALGLAIAGLFLPKDNDSSLNNRINELNEMKCDNETCSELEREVENLINVTIFLNETKCDETTCETLNITKCETTVCETFANQINELNHTISGNCTFNCLNITVDLLDEIDFLNRTKCDNTTCLSLQDQIDHLNETKSDNDTCRSLQDQIDHLNETKCDNDTCRSLQDQIDHLNETKCDNDTCRSLQDQIDHLNETKCDNDTCRSLQDQIDHLNETKCDNDTCRSLQDQINHLSETKCDEATCQNISASISAAADPPLAQSFYNGLGTSGNETHFILFDIPASKIWVPYRNISILLFSHNVTFNPPQTSFEIHVSGIYFLKWDLSVDALTGTPELRFSILNNNMILVFAAAAIEDVSGSDRPIRVTISTLANVNSGDIISFQFMNFSSAADIQVLTSSETILRVSSNLFL